MNDFETIATVNYGHFTVIPVLPDGVRGLKLHLERLDRDARIVFGHGIDGDEVRARVHEAVQGHELPVNARVMVFARNLPSDDLTNLPKPDLAIAVRPMRETRAKPPRVLSSVYRRDLPEVKHVGTFGLLHQRRLAHLAGYDDVLFVDEDGWIAEGSVWNIGFYDGERIIWPQAPALPGVEMTFLQDALPFETRKVNLSDLGGFRSAFMTSATTGPGLIAAIDDVTFEPDPELATMLAAAHAAIPLEPLVVHDDQGGSGLGGDL